LADPELDMAVTLIHPSDASKNIKLAIFEVDDSAQTLKVMFGGAHSAVYGVEVRSGEHGTYFIDAHLNVHATITNISPRSGSVLGGTIVTITGENFSEDPLNNPVTMNLEFAQIISSSETQIVARLPATEAFQHLESNPETVVVGLKTSEEAQCGGLEEMSENYCKFTFTDAETGVLDSVTIADSADGESLEISFVGTNFGLSAQVYLDGAEQEILSATDELVVAKVTNFNNLSVEKFEFYSATGAPRGFFDKLSAIDFSSHLSLRSVTAQGSTGGSKIVAAVVGLGAVTDGEISIQLLDGTTEICEDVSVPEFGTVLCTVAPGTFTAAELSLQVNGNTYSCHDGLDASTCLYTTDLDPQVSLVSGPATQATITGSGLDLGSFD